MKFQVFQGKNQKWYWRLVAANGKVTADGAQGYATCQNARRAVRSLTEIFTNFSNFEVETIDKKEKAR